MMKWILGSLLLLSLACNQGQDGYDGAADAIPAAGEVMEETALVKQTAVPLPEDQKIIKTAHLSFETDDVNATHQKILQLASQYRGLVQRDNSGKSYNRIFRTLTVRIPTENFQPFLDDISKGVDYFDQKQITRQDVTEEFVDLQARLKTKRELEKRYLQLLQKANNVKDMLDIERELANIREEIEARQGRLQYLQNQVSMSTVHLEFYKTTAETGITQSYGQKIKNALRGGWNGVSVVFLGFLYLWPLFVFVVILVAIIRFFLKRRKKK